MTAGLTLPQEFLAAENVSLRLLLTQAELNAQALLAQAGIDAKEREASDKLQKLILEELPRGDKQFYFMLLPPGRRRGRSGTLVQGIDP